MDIRQVLSLLNNKQVRSLEIISLGYSLRAAAISEGIHEKCFARRIARIRKALKVTGKMVWSKAELADVGAALLEFKYAPTMLSGAPIRGAQYRIQSLDWYKTMQEVQRIKSKLGQHRASNPIYQGLHTSLAQPTATQQEPSGSASDKSQGN